MRQQLLKVILALCLLYLALMSFTNLRSYRSLPVAELNLKLQELSNVVAVIKRTHGGAPTDPKNRQEYYRTLGEQGKVWLELTIRQSYLDRLITILLTLTVVMLMALKIKERQSTIAGTPAEVLRDMDVMVDPPREEYIDEWELPNRAADGFASKEDAVHFLKNDPTLSCDYCGGVLRSTFTNKRESIAMVTFYKNVPTGAKDLRVVLGSYWFPKQATELRCGKCGREVHR